MMSAAITKFHRDVLTQARAICAAAGAQCWLDHAGGKHSKIFIAKDGLTRFTPISRSPSTPDQHLLYKLSDVRRILREMGR